MAIKLEQMKTKSPQLHLEYRFYKLLGSSGELVLVMHLMYWFRKWWLFDPLLVLMKWDPVLIKCDPVLIRCDPVLIKYGPIAKAVDCDPTTHARFHLFFRPFLLSEFLPLFLNFSPSFWIFLPLSESIDCCFSSANSWRCTKNLLLWPMW